MRFEKGHKAETRKHILRVAAKRFRQDGISAAGIAGIMGEAGLTNGAFYPHFSSKEELVREAISATVSEQRHRAEEILQADRGLEEVIRTYLSREHLRAPSCGCPSAALLPEIARQPAPTRAAYEAGINSYVAALALRIRAPDAAAATSRATAILALMVGSLQYARATTNEAAADRILESGIEAAMLLARQSAA